MSNVEIDAPLVNGDLMPYHERGESCRLAVEMLIGDDFGAPPRSLNFTVHTDSGKTVKLVIPYDHTSSAVVLVDGERL
ncbi:hypothetical protein [Sphingobium tyrosinilyticum]|uniref:Uncharacterized protein n=1 Tax=Sphingobium tyrosinilyticum TaxID=2715436 RepID=A0ABV9EV15_9SPHN